MFGKLVPWKKLQGVGDVAIRHDREHKLSQFRDEFDALWDRFWDDWRGLEHGRWRGRVNLNEDDREFVLRAELPGYEPEDFDIKISGNTLILRAEHKDEGQDDNGAQYSRYGSFYESFSLPAGIDDNHIDARYHSGVLEVHLPKGEDYKSARIPVTAA